MSVQGLAHDHGLGVATTWTLGDGRSFLVNVIHRGVAFSREYIVVYSVEEQPSRLTNADEHQESITCLKLCANPPIGYDQERRLGDQPCYDS